MSSIAKIISLLALVVAIAPSLAYFLGMLEGDAMKWTMLAGTILWFLSTPFWMGIKPEVDDMEVQI